MISAVVLPVIVGEVTLCCVLKGDHSASSSQSLESAARVTALVTSAPAPPPTHGVNQIQNSPPSALIVTDLSYFSGYFLGGLVPTVELCKVIYLKLLCEYTLIALASLIHKH